MASPVFLASGFQCCFSCLLTKCWLINKYIKKQFREVYFFPFRIFALSICQKSCTTNAAMRQHIIIQMSFQVFFDHKISQFHKYLYYIFFVNLYLLSTITIVATIILFSVSLLFLLNLLVKAPKLSVNRSTVIKLEAHRPDRARRIFRWGITEYCST